MLNAIVKKGGLSLDEAAEYRQDTLGSFVQRGYLAYDRSGKRLNPTDVAVLALTQFREADIHRRIESSVLSIWFYRKERLAPPREPRKPNVVELRDVKQRRRAG